MNTIFYRWWYRPILVNITFPNCPYSEVPKATILNTSATLDEIRTELSQCENGESIMKIDMYFCNNRGSNIIRRSDETNIYLHQILDNNNDLYVWRSENLEEVI